MQKFVKIFVSLLLILSPAFTTNAAEELVPIDAVLVLDVSLSMRTADPNRIANDAMNMFIDMLEPGRDRVGVVAYAGHVSYSRGLILLCEEETPRLQDAIYHLEYASWTDHPLGLLEALHILYEGNAEDPERQQMIIFLTDGNLNVNPRGARTTAQTVYDKAVVINLAQERGIPIYSIGLNFDGLLDRKYTEIVAYETGGLAFETANAEDLPNIIDAIFTVMVTTILYEEPPPEDEIIEEPEPVPTPLPLTEPPTYIPYEPSEDSGKIWLFAIAIILAAAFILFITTRKSARVFTGRLTIEIIRPGSNHTHPLQYRNLIEYGSRTNLQRLLDKKTDAVFDKVIITPSPTAPSHLPQLLIKCKSSRVKVSKNFMEQDAAKGIVISPGTEINIAPEGGDMQIRLRYTV